MKTLAFLMCGSLAGGTLLYGSGLKVMAPNGEPVDGAHVEVWSCLDAQRQGRQTMPLLQGKTNAAGELPRPLPRVDCLALLIDADRAAPWIGESHFDDRSVVELDTGLRVRGSLAGVDEASLGSAQVCATWESSFGAFQKIRKWQRCAEPSASGEFEIQGVPEQEVELLAVVPRHLSQRVRTAPGKNVALELQKGIAVGGAILDAAGQAIAGARIAGVEDTETTSKPDGSFEIAVPALPVKLEISADGFHTRVLAVETANAARQIRLERGEELTGILLGEQSLPLSEAEIWLDRQVTPTRWATQKKSVTTHKGDFHLSLDSPGEYRVRIRAKGFREERLPSIEVAPGTTYRLGVIGMSRGCTVEGRMVDEATGQAMPGVALELFPQGGAVFDLWMHGGSPHEVTDSEGRFILDAPGGGRYELRVSRSGFASLALPVRVFEDRVVALGDIVLRAGVELGGEVLRRGDEEPLPGVAVAILDPENADWRPIVETTTDPRGRFQGLRLLPGAYRVRIKGESVLLAQRLDVATEPARQNVVFRVGGPHVRGVVHRRGEPAGAGSLSLVSALDPYSKRGKMVLRFSNTRGADLGSEAFNFEQSTVSCEVSASGTFSVANAPTGLVRATYSDSQGHLSTKEITIPDEAEPQVAIEIGGSSVVGVVVDSATQQGLPGRIDLLTARGQLASAVADEQGRFSFPDLDAGFYSLHASAEGYAPAIVEHLAVPAEADTVPVSIPLVVGGVGELATRLVRADGSALSGALVTLLDEQGGVVRSAPANTLGERKFAGLAPGRYRVVWSDATSGTGSSGELAVRSQETTLFEQTLPDGGTLQLHCDPEFCGDRAVQSITLRDRQGLALESYLSGVSAALRFSPDGVLDLGWLAPGEYELELTVGRHRWTRQVSMDGPAVQIAVP